MLFWSKAWSAYNHFYLRQLCWVCLPKLQINKAEDAETLELAYADLTSLTSEILSFTCQSNTIQMSLNYFQSQATPESSIAAFPFQRYTSTAYGASLMFRCSSELGGYNVTCDCAVRLVHYSLTMSGLVLYVQLKGLSSALALGGGWSISLP